MNKPLIELRTWTDRTNILLRKEARHKRAHIQCRPVRPSSSSTGRTKHWCHHWSARWLSWWRRGLLGGGWWSGFRAGWWPHRHACLVQIRHAAHLRSDRFPCKYITLQKFAEKRLNKNRHLPGVLQAQSGRATGSENRNDPAGLQSQDPGRPASLWRDSRYSRGFDEQPLPLLELPFQTFHFHFEFDVLPAKMRKEEKQRETRDPGTCAAGKPLSAQTNLQDAYKQADARFKPSLTPGHREKGIIKHWWSQKEALDFSRLGTIM